jgi:hypothetical protein
MLKAYGTIANPGESTVRPIEKLYKRFNCVGRRIDHAKHPEQVDNT